MSYKLGSLFDGSGGFPLAGALCDIEPIWASEIEPYPIAVTTSRFPKLKHLGDISKINGAEIEPVDIITFGSPCQDLSVAGKRAGLKHEANGDEETTRSGLFMEAVRIIKEMREKTNGKYPRFAVWENVPGAFSSNKGEDFRIVLEELIKIIEPSVVMPEVPQKGWAYADTYVGDGWSLAYRVLDAQYWGVPQRRRRIYLVTDFGGQCAKDILFKREGLSRDFNKGRTPWKTTPTYAQGSTGADDRKRTDGIIAIDKESYTSGVGFNRAPGISIGGPCATLQASSQPHAVCYPLENKNYIDVEVEVATRKYEVDTERLSECLRAHKGDLTNKEIAEILDKPLTLVEHWFRKDTYFAIPEPDVWLDLKKLLGIETTEFDQSIMEFEYKGGNFDMRNRIYSSDTAPTLTCDGGNKFYLLPRIEQVPFCKSRRAKNPDDFTTWKDGKVANTLNTFDQGEVRTNELIVETVALEGNGQRPSHFGDGYSVTDKSYTLNTTEKHGVAYGTVCVADHPTPKIDENGTAFTLSARDYKNPQALAYESDIKPHYIVRRLTPTECARLQGFADRWGDILAKTELTDEEYQFWLDVRKTYDAINGRQEKDYTVKQMLTWYNKLQTDSAEYKMWGNGIALPTALYVLEGVAEALDDWMN